MEKALSCTRFMILGLCLLQLVLGCATPPQPSRSGRLDPDQEDTMGGHFLESTDIRTIASQMGPEILSVPEIADNPNPSYIATAPVRNSTRYLIDKDILMKRLRLELNRYGAGRVRFVSQNMGQGVRRRIIEARDEDVWEQAINEVADSLAASGFAQSLTQPVTVAVLPPRNVNLVDINAESFMAFLRAEVVNKLGGKMRFIIVPKAKVQKSAAPASQPVPTATMIRASTVNVNINKLNLEGNNQPPPPPDDVEEALPEADYYLAGEFIAKSIMEESLTTKTVAQAGRDPNDPRRVKLGRTKKREKPNVAKYLNVILAESGTNASVFEKIIKLESKMKSGLGRTSLVLTGELSALSKAGAGGDRSDYILTSFQLVDPESNIILWENAYETKRTSTRSIIYK